MTAPVWIATPSGAAYCASPAKPGTLTCTVCAYAKQPPGPCKLCRRTEAPERRD
jgi:hypothetical protein